MCKSCGCTKPEEKKDNPKECAPEEISKCHPESEQHPCEEKKEDQQQEQ